MNNIRDTIAQVFNILHDGSIIKCAVNGNNLELTIKMEYTTKFMQPDFQLFYILLSNCSNVHFLPWKKNKNETISYTKDLEVITNELTILNKKTDLNTIEIMSQVEGSNDLVGGIFTFSASNILIFTKDKKQLSLEKLQKIAEQYWGNSGS